MIALAILVAGPAWAAAPHKGGTYGGGWLEDVTKIRVDGSLPPGEQEDKRAREAVRSVVTLKVAKSGDAVDGRVRARYRCPSAPKDFATTRAIDFGSAKIDADGRFSAKVPYSETGDGGAVTRSGTATVRGTIGGFTARGILELAWDAGSESCKLLDRRWRARDVRAPRKSPRRGAAKAGTPYYGTNSTTQDVFDSEGARGIFMLRTAKKRRAVSQAYMYALWTCTGPDPGSYFENFDLLLGSKISGKGKFKKNSTVNVTGEDGAVTTFKTSFQGRFARGAVTGTWRSSMETGDLRCDTGRVRFKALR